MARFIPVGRRCAGIIPLSVVGGLCFFLTACGGSGGPVHKYSGAARSGDVAPGQPPNGAVLAGPEKSNQETYGTIVENPFRSPKVAPRSTFSSDVNTASYSNVRRFLRQAKLPPRDAVFLAEMVNYFPYRYPDPLGDDPVSLTLDLAPCPWKPEHKLARIGVKARHLAPSETPQRNLVFLIDVSGSMDSEERLPLVKKSFELLVDQLTPADWVSIVTYAGDAGLKLPPTPGDQKRRILDVIRSLKADGSTNGEGAIKLAYETARRHYLDSGTNRVILCTDGDFNVGQTSESELVQLIERERASRVFLTVLGYGMGNLKNQMLELLAYHGNGHYAYIDTIDEARKVFVEQGGALTCVAKDVKFQVEFNPTKVGAYRLIGYENRTLKDEDFKDDNKNAGAIGSGLTVTALYEIVPVGVKIDLPGVDPLKYQNTPPSGSTSDEWLMVKMRYKLPDGDASKELAALPATAGSGTMAVDFQFAAAVAEFGLLLRDSPYKGNATLADALRWAELAIGDDLNGHRKEFLDLVRLTTGLKEHQKKE